MNYNAFISYSHKSDNEFAPSLQKGLHHIARPLFKLRALNIFRDTTNLSVSPHLWHDIETALFDSEFFILLASPEVVDSKWVKKEVNFWLSKKSIENLIIVVTGGSIQYDDEKNDFDWELTDCLPHNLIGKFQEEPLYVDFREQRNDDNEYSLKNPDFKNKVVTIAAKLHKKAVNDLVGEDIRILTRTKNIRNFFITLLMVFVVGLIFMLNKIIQQRDIARNEATANYYISESFEAPSNTEGFWYFWKAYHLSPSFNKAQFLNSISDPIVYYNVIADSMEFKDVIATDSFLVSLTSNNLMKVFTLEGEEITEKECPIPDYASTGENIQGSKNKLFLFANGQMKILKIPELSVLHSWNYRGGEITIVDNDVYSLTDENMILKYNLEGTHVDSFQMTEMEIQQYQPIDSNNFLILKDDSDFIGNYSEKGVLLHRYFTGTNAKVNNFDFDLNTKKIIAGSNLNQGYLWDKPGIPSTSFDVLENRIESEYQFSPSGQLIFSTASFSTGFSIQHLDGRQIGFVSYHKENKGYSDVGGFTNGEHSFFSYSLFSDKLFLWDLRGAKIPASIHNEYQRISENEKFRVEVDKNIKVWNITESELVFQSTEKILFKRFFEYNPSGFAIFHNQDSSFQIIKENSSIEKKIGEDISFIKSSLKQPFFFIATTSGLIIKFDTLGNEVFRKNIFAGRSIDFIEFFKEEESYLIGGGVMFDTSCLALYNQNFDLIENFEGTGQEIISAAFSNDGSLMAYGDFDGVIRVWDMKTRKEINYPSQLNNDGLVSSMEFSDDNNYLVTINAMMQFSRVWDLKHGYAIQTVGYPSEIDRLCLIEKGKVILVNDEDNAIYKNIRIDSFFKSDRIVPFERIYESESLDKKLPSY